ncbi:AraC family transcriptional regulator [Vibrio mexicanus]|uniref:AraC family transcriptional regulator n=1 Tax=Vibrio mexicanus TaxID=1004326 RepID=UPI00063C0586|nr:AraC family transcriptional regulator [Vibrio mexicanus]
MKAISTKTLIRPGYSWRHHNDIAAPESTALHFHREYELLLLFNYHGTVQVGNIDIEVNPCSLILIPPNVSHDLRKLEILDQTCQPERHSLWIDKDWLSSMLVYCNEMGKLANMFSKPEKGILFSHVTSKLAKEAVNQIDYKMSSLEQLSVLIRVFSLISQDHDKVILSATRSSTFDDEKDRVEAISQFLDNNYTKEINLSDLSKHVYCSERTVNRIFKKHFGETFSQRLKKIRLSQAAHLLETTQLTVSHISSMVGYHNLSNFNRLFKAYKGLTPNEYRVRFSN